MSTTVEKRTISLSSEQAAYIDAKVRNGDYASASEVVRAGLRALHERDAAIEQWLRTEVASAYDAMKAHPDRAIPLDAAFARLRDRHVHKKARGKV
jgi:antitoxin ParD1/3/4